MEVEGQPIIQKNNLDNIFRIRLISCPFYFFKTYPIKIKFYP